MSPIILFVILLVLAFDGILMAILIPCLFLVRKAMEHDLKISIVRLVGMRLKKMNPKSLVEALILAQKNGITDIDLDHLEAHSLAGGNVTRVAEALVLAKKEKLEITFEQACEFDLSGRSIPLESK